MPAWPSLIAGRTLAAVCVASGAGCASAPPPTAAAVARQQHALAVARAAEYCRSKGLEMRTGATADAPARAAPAAADFPFRCVKAR
jgi:hypothetical protein